MVQFHFELICIEVNSMTILYGVYGVFVCTEWFTWMEVLGIRVLSENFQPSFYQASHQNSLAGNNSPPALFSKFHFCVVIFVLKSPHNNNNMKHHEVPHKYLLVFLEEVQPCHY